ncbi:1-deoxy-D-xylulose-5-phosphate reductoisomerase [Ottowia thiooxydans]|uniref:1-deoxy-D-xylulose 5-phosphate reductoisomerase n=1 Tax=Ottowia thiooxydans TaxID=219182 RepID=A0ABV2QBR3_9BURK
MKTGQKQRVAILGSTGSIGTNTLDVIARHPDRFEVVALTAATQVEAMLAQVARFKPRLAVMASEEHGRVLAEKIKQNGLSTVVATGPAAIEAIAGDDGIDTVMAAIVGAAGLAPCLAAARAGKRLLLANKEALVVGGRLFMDAVRTGGATLLPIDSEHSAIFQCLPEDPASWAARIDRIHLTSSGGPFRQLPLSELSGVTPDQACAHPNFSMGRKISVDSATMMNKALEVIEARWLFDLAPEQIEVVVHPQQIIHSMVEFTDASVLAQLGTPDMRVPIAYGLSWPERIESGAARLDFSRLAGLHFEPPSRERFPGLFLSWEALRAPEGTTAVLNAANEISVAAFLDQRIGFADIHAVNDSTLAAVSPTALTSLADLLELDAATRRAAEADVRRRSA